MNTLGSPLHRRKFLLGASALAVAQQAGWFNAMAAPLVGSDYRALVCVFLYGGNDANNTVIPTDSAGYASYQAVRGSSGLGLAKDSLVTLDGVSFGLHPALADMRSLWQSGALAIQANVGTLSHSMTKAEYGIASNVRPRNLFSHSDQQAQWQSGIYNDFSSTGWGGRIADLGSTGGSLPAAISVAGNQLWINGEHSPVLVIPTGSSLSLTGVSGTTNAKFTGLNRLFALDHTYLQEAAASQVFSGALGATGILDPILNGTSPMQSLFTGQTSSIAKQLLQVARLIERRSSIGATRQIFFVSLGGFDTHTNQMVRQNDLFTQLGPALKSFYDATVALGVQNQVTAFTGSDFSRTLKPASGGGSDHAWGGHHFVIGGAVKGAKIYGQFPSLVLKGPDDVSSEGRWLPTTSVDQYIATLASWFGVQANDLATVVPNINAFGVKNMGFLNV